MQHVQFQKFAHYNQKMNHKLYAAARALPAEDRTANRGAFFGSLQSTLQHILVADLIWLGRFRSVPALSRILQPVSEYPSPGKLDEALYPDFETLLQAREKLDALIVGFASALSPELMQEQFSYTTLAGKRFEQPFWVCVAHFFNHQTHHRGQATTLLSQLGVDVGVTDFLHVIRED